MRRGNSMNHEIDELTAQLSKPAEPHFNAVIRALQEIGESAVEPLCLALKDNKEDTRLGAAIALGEIADVRSLDPLIDALENESSYSHAYEPGWYDDPEPVHGCVGRS